MPPPPAVLLSSNSPLAAEDLRSALIASGFVVVDHALGSSPSVDFEGIVAAVIDVGSSVEAAVAQSRRWRLERGDERVPVLWVLPSASAEVAAGGLDAGADACLARPLDAATVPAQVRALARAHAATLRLAAKAAETRLLGEQLRKTYGRLDLMADVAGRIHRLCLPEALPRFGPASVVISRMARGSVARDFHDVRRLDEHHIGFFLGTILGQDAAISSLLAILIRQAAVMKETGESGYRLIPPDAVLAGVNRQLLALGLEDPPLVAMAAGILDSRDGSIALARAGLPQPVYLPDEGPDSTWGVPGPFLGTAETAFEAMAGRLPPGSRLVLGTSGTRVDDDAQALLRSAARNRERMGQAFAEAVAAEILPKADQREDFTLMVVAMANA